MCNWWFTFSLSQTSSFDSRTKCLFSSSRNVFRPCSLWNETIAQPYLKVIYGEWSQLRIRKENVADLTPTQVLSCLFLNQ